MKELTLAKLLELLKVYFKPKVKNQKPIKKKNKC